MKSFAMKLIPSILLLCSLSAQSLFAFTLLTLPNLGFFEIKTTSTNFGSPEELEALARKRKSLVRDEELFLTRFKDEEKTKADLALIEESIDLLKPFHLDEIETILGPPQQISENYLRPAVFYYGALSVSAHQNSGEVTAAFFPIGELGGIYVFQFEKRKTISAGAVYLKRDHSYQEDNRTGDARVAAREIERPELEAIKAALETRVAEHSAE